MDTVALGRIQKQQLKRGQSPFFLFRISETWNSFYIFAIV